MSQTPDGVKKHRETMIAKHGSYEAWREWMRNNGSKGGSAPHSKPTGFASLKLSDPARLKEISIKGGRKRQGK